MDSLDFGTHLPARRPSARLRIVHAALAVTARPFFELAVWIDRHALLEPATMLRLSSAFDSVLWWMRPPRGTRREQVQTKGCRGEWLWDGANDSPYDSNAAIVYLHGGGLVACGLNSHRRLVARIARESRVPAFNVEYRQIPEAHVVETVADCLAGFEYVTDTVGIAPDRVVLVGDSAGGGLAFSVALALREKGQPLPAGIAVISPWADYDATTRAVHANAGNDPIFSPAVFALPPRWGIARGGTLDPAWSPVNHDLHGLPPVFIQVGSTETLLPDTESLELRCRESAVDVEVQVWERGFHVFHAAADLIPEARQAITALAHHIGQMIGRIDDTAVKGSRSA